MMDNELIQALRGHADWAKENEWDAPIALSDDLETAADRLANQNTHILALQREIEGLRRQNQQLREASALLTKKSADLLERRWIPVEERYEIDDPYCSECGKLNESVWLNYCPHCGAKMDGGAADGK